MTGLRLFARRPVVKAPERQINVPLLRKVLEHIEAHPQEWNQSYYRCESGLCFAGWAVELSGGKWATNSGDFLVAEPEDDPQEVNAFGGVYCPDRAKRILGLTGHEAAFLFYFRNDIDDIRTQVAGLIALAES